MSLSNSFPSADFPLPPPPAHLHFLGGGGVGMCGLALLAQDLGYFVTAADSRESSLTRILIHKGISVEIGTAHAPPCDLAVYTLALAEEDPAIAAYRQRGTPLLSRADLLGLFCRFFTRRVGVAGMHGKSTVTAMLGEILSVAGEEATVLCGAHMADGAVYRLGRPGGTLIYEACEYRNSFLATHPTVALVTNLDYDHPDFFADMAEVRRSFSHYIHKPTVVAAVLNGDDAETPTVAIPPMAPTMLFGGENGDLTAGAVTREAGCCSFTAFYRREQLGRIRLRVPGDYQIQNALAALGGALTLGVDPCRAVFALSHFTGIGRRMEYKGEISGMRVYDDYAHHPTELAAALTAARRLAGQGRVLYVFQSHTYSRTRALLHDFSRALALGDVGVVLDVYAAREEDDGSNAACRLAEAAGAHYAPDMKKAAQCILECSRAGDVCVLLGAGNVGEVWHHLIPPAGSP